MTAIDKAAVLASLRCSDVCRHYSHPLRRVGDTWRSKLHPSLAIHDGDRKWSRHSEGIRASDALGLIAYLEGIDLRSHFGRVLEIGAQIAGIDANAQSTAEQRRALEQARRDRLADEQRIAAKALSDSIVESTTKWESLAADHPRGREYLESRSITSCVGNGLIVRFDEHGNPVLPCRNRDGQIQALQTRLITPRGPRRFNTLGKVGHTTFGDPRHVATTSGPAVITEGFADFLSAIELHPDRFALSAHSAAGLPDIVELIAPRLVADGRGLLLAVHNDSAGEREGLRAARAAIAAGLAHSGDAASGGLEIFDLGNFADLNDWLRDGRGNQ